MKHYYVKIKITRTVFLFNVYLFTPNLIQLFSKIKGKKLVFHYKSYAIPVDSETTSDSFTGTLAPFWTMDADSTELIIKRGRHLLMLEKRLALGQI